MASPRNWTATAFLAVTIDGHIARKDGRIDFLPPPPKKPASGTPNTAEEDSSEKVSKNGSAILGAAKRDVGEGVPTHEEMIKEMDLVVMGRKTFESVVEICTGHTGDGMDVEVGEIKGLEWPYGDIPTVVLTGRGPEELPLSNGLKASGSLEVASCIEDVVRVIETEGYKQVWLDGGVTLMGFLERDLIDELVLTTMPVMLGGEGGGGLSLWEALRLERDLKWECVGCEGMEGLVAVKWRRARDRNHEPEMTVG